MPSLGSVSKYFTMAKEGFATTLNGTINDSVTTISLNAFSGYSNGDSVFFTIDATDSSGTATPALREVVYGEKSTNDLINVVRGVEGTAQSHTSGANVADYVTAAHWSALNTGLLVAHEKTGVHKSGLTLPAPTIADFSNAAHDHGDADDGGAIVAGAIGAIITNAKLSTAAGEIGAAWQDWTPSWTNLTAGNGTLNVAKYIQIGKSVSFYLKFTLGSTSSIGGSVSVTLPVTASANEPTAAMAGMGWARYDDTGTSNFYGVMDIISTTQMRFLVVNAAGTYATNAALTSSIPHTWANTDIISCRGFYEAA